MGDTGDNMHGTEIFIITMWSENSTNEMPNIREYVKHKRIPVCQILEKM